MSRHRPGLLGAGVNLATIIGVVKQRKALVLWSTFATTVVVGLVTLLLPPTYRAAASLLVAPGREFIYRPEFEGLQPANMFRLQELINSEIEILESQQLAARVVKELGPTKVYPALADEADADRCLRLAAAQFEEDLTITGVPESSVIQIAFVHTSPELAAESVNLLVARFVEKHLAMFGDDRSAFLERELETARAAFAVADETVAKYEQQHGLWNVEEQLKLLLAARNQMMTTQLAALTTEPQRADRGVEQARAELARLLVQEQEVLGKYQPTSRQVTTLRNAIAAADDFVRRTQEAELARLATLDASLNQHLAKLEDEIRQLESHRRHLALLQREAANLDTRAQAAAGRLDEARMSEQLDKEKRISIRVIDSALPPVNAQGLSKSRRLLLGVVVGFVLGLALALVRHVLAEGR